MRSILFCVVAAAIAVSAKADSLTYTVTPEAGDFSYSFVLTNTGDTGGTLFDLFLSIPLDISDIDSSTIGTPVGWGDPTGGLLFFGSNVSPSTSFIEWADDPSGLYDVQIGDSLGGFSFTSTQEVTSSITFALNGSTASDLSVPLASIPEPTSDVFGCITLLLCHLVRREKSSARITC